MNPLLRSSLSFAALAASAHGAIIITTATNGLTAGTSTSDELAYTSFVSTTDLLHGIIGTGGTWNASGSSPAGLNDGVHGGDSTVNVAAALSGAAWAQNGTTSFREFVIGNGANGLGYDITGIQSIAAWQGGGFQNQKYEVLVSTVGSSSFTLLTTVDFQPSNSTAATDNQGGSTRVNVTENTTGILATGIDAIRFNILDTVGNAAGGAVIREIDVFGASTVPEPSATLLGGLGLLALLRRRRD